MQSRALFLAAFVILPLTSLPSQADVPAEFAGRGCTVWASDNGTGEAVRVVVRDTGDGGRSYNWIQNTINPSRDNDLSSIKCDTHCSASFYDQPYRAGGEIFVVDGQSGFVSLSGNSANNRASSLSVYCAR